MANYKVTKEYGFTKISADVKAGMYDTIIPALKAQYGEENVAWGRVGLNTSSPKNVLLIRAGVLTDEEGYEHDLISSLDGTVKSYKEKKTSKYTVPVVDFDEAVQAYQDYLTEKATKQAEAEAKKAERKTNGSKTKQEKEAEKAKKAAELDEASARVKAKQKAEAETKRYKVEVDGEVVAENLTMAEATAKRDELADSGEVKIFEQR